MEHSRRSQEVRRDRLRRRSRGVCGQALQKASAIAVAFSAVWAQAAPPPPPQSVGQDLAATIALHGLRCDQVVDSKRNGDSDYTATCKDGNRYHIFIDAQGRVVVKKL